VTSFTAGVNSVNWSPCGRYLAIGGQVPTSPANDITVFRFDGSSLSLTAAKDYGTVVDSVNWSPCGKFLAVGGNGPLTPAANDVTVFGFDGASLSFTATAAYGTRVFSVNWSPCGTVLAVGGDNPLPNSDEKIKVFSVMNAPTNCIIDGNKASNSSSNGDIGRGVGIAGLCGNLFIRNIAYQNVINITGGVPYKFFYYDPVGPLGLFDNVWTPNC